jgi:hypothetical protein
MRPTVLAFVLLCGCQDSASLPAQFVGEWRFDLDATQTAKGNSGLNGRTLERWMYRYRVRKEVFELDDLGNYRTSAFNGQKQLKEEWRYTVAGRSGNTIWLRMESPDESEQFVLQFHLRNDKLEKLIVGEDATFTAVFARAK